MRLCSYSFLGGMSSSLGKGSCFGILSFEVKNMKTQISCDILIAGGGLGGCAAALSACRLGQSVILTEECDWIGGQLTSQAVSAPDEHPWIESFGGTETWARLRNGIRQYYKAHYPLVPSARAKSRLNPGNGDVSALCHEPRVALAVLEEMLSPFLASGRLTLLTRHQPVSAQVQEDKVISVTFKNLCEDNLITVEADYVLDATELGDLLPLTGTEYVSGAESQSDTQEPHALAGPADPEDVQSFTYCFLMDYQPNENWVIDKPQGYEEIKKSQPLQWVQPHPVTLKPRQYCLFPGLEEEGYSLWRYRRVVDKTNFEEDFFPSDLCLVNWPHNDFMGGNLIDKDPQTKENLLQSARNLSFSLLYWLQTEAPRPDGGAGYPGLRLRPDGVGTAHGLAQYPYIRESRRIKPVFRVTELHVASELRPDKKAELFPDSVGIGLYRIDLHPSSGGKPYIDVGCCPFQIPLGALLPVRIKNLIPANKNIGTTHITNGAYRLHPVEWNIGESAGALASFCLQYQVPPQAVREKENLLQTYQQNLVKLGISLKWPEPHAI